MIDQETLEISREEFYTLCKIPDMSPVSLTIILNAKMIRDGWYILSASPDGFSALSEEVYENLYFKSYPGKKLMLLEKLYNRIMISFSGKNI